MKSTIFFAIVALAGCAAQGEDAKQVRETYTNALLRVDTSIKGLAETQGNTNAELEAIREELKAVRSEVSDLTAGVESLNKLLTASEAPEAPVLQIRVPDPPAEAQPTTVVSSGVTFQGKPIDVNAWLRRSVVTVEINGDVDKHLRDHGLEGDFSRFSRSQKIHLHSVAHTYGVPLKSAAPRKVVVRPAVVLPRASNCANGNCARGWSFSWSRRR